jgi:hypothetical protein
MATARKPLHQHKGTVSGVGHPNPEARNHGIPHKPAFAEWSGFQGGNGAVGKGFLGNHSGDPQDNTRITISQPLGAVNGAEMQRDATRKRLRRNDFFDLAAQPYALLRFLAIVLAHYWELQAGGHRSSMGRYNTLIDDIRNDIVRIGPFFDTAHRVLDLDRRREASIELMADLRPVERLGALARVGENSLTIAWVQQSLAQRCAAYRFALDHLVAGEPEKIAADADIVLTQLQQKITANQVVPLPRFADLSGRVLAPKAAAGGK